MNNLDAAIIHGLKEFIEIIETLRYTQGETLKVFYSWQEFQAAGNAPHECDFFMVKEGYGIGYSY